MREEIPDRRKGLEPAKTECLTKLIAQLMEELKELHSKKARLLARFDYSVDRDMKQVNRETYIISQKLLQEQMLVQEFLPFILLN